jgi:hypothetical protein
MKKTRKAAESSADMRAQYKFDYGLSRPNRFASRMKGNVVAVVLAPDVAQVFDTSEAVNQLLRSVISAIPDRTRRAAIRKPDRKRTSKRMVPTRAGS